MSDISKIKLASGKEYNIKDSYARELIGTHTHPIDTELDDSSTNPVQNSVITNALNNKADANHTHNLESLGIVYGKCFNMENILAKKVSLPDYVLCNNSIVSIKFNYNVKQNSTLNINNTGDKPIYYDNKSIINNIIKAGDTATFIYDGTNYNLINLDKNSYTQYFEANNEIIANSGQCILCNGGENYSYSLIKNNIIYIKFKYFVYANAILNISLSGYIPIYYKGSPIKDGIIRPNDIGVFIYDGTNYNLISVYTSSSTCINSYYFTCSRYEGTKYAITNSYAAELAKFNKGDIVAVHFNDNIDDDNSTLQIGSNNNGYLPICNAAGSPIPGGIIKANDTLVFIYDETKYRCIYSFNYSASLNLYFDNGECQESATCSTATEQILKETTSFRYSDIYHFAGAITYITFENAVPANSTLNNKPIYYKGYPIIDGIINAGDTAMFMSDGTNLHLISLTNENKYSSSNISNILFNIDRNKADNTHTHNIASMGFGFNFCNTTTETADKTASISNYTLNLGGVVSIKFNYAVLANATLNINDTGAKSIYYKGSAITDGIIKAGDIATFIYDGTNYNLISLDRDFNPITIDTALSTTSTNPVQNSVITNALNNHTHTNESMGFGYSYTNYSYFCGIVDDYNTLTDGNIIICDFQYNVPANATLNINSTGDKPIYYNGSAITEGIINAGDTVILKYNENLDLSFSRFDFIGLYHFYELHANNSNSQEEINIDAPIYEIEIINGQNFNIRFDYDVPANATLNIDGIDDDAKPIYYNGSPITNDIIKANDNVIFIYNINDGRYDLLATDNYNNENVNHFYYDFALICYRISLDGYTQTKGGMVSIKFYNNVAPNATLNINDTGAIPIYYKGSAITDGIIKAGDIATFIYDGTNYNLISLDRNFNFTNESMGFGYGTCSTAASTIAKTVSIINYKLTKGGIVSVKFNNDVIANATLDINITGDKPIYYNGSAITDNIIKAGDTATFIYDGTKYNLISLDRDFNPITVDSSLSTTSTNPVENNVITNALNNHTHTNESMGFGYGTCDTADLILDKTVLIDNYKLSAGGIVSIRFLYDVLEGTTLNINNTGNIPIFYNNDPITDDIIKAEDTATFIYDGYNYNLIALNNSSNERMGFGYSDTNYSCFCGIIDDYALTDGDIIICEFDYDVPVNATFNINSRLSINSTGDKPIYYNGSPITDGIIEAGDVAILKYNENLDLSFSRFDFIGLYHFYELHANNSNSQEEINIDAPYALTNGQIFNIKFDYDVPANAVLNISSMSDIPIYYNGSTITNGNIKAGDIAIFIYNNNDDEDETNDRCDLLAIDNYNNENMNHYYYATALICYRITLDGYTQTKNGMVSIKFDYDVVPNATLNINSTGVKPIYYKGSDITGDIIKAGDIATFIYDGTNYRLISLDRDFNPITVDTALSTTSTNPVQNSVITNALNNKADANHTHTDATASSGGLMSATDKANIDNFAANFKNKLSIANGIATLDSNGKVPSTQLPSYVDDIIEGYLYNNTLYEEDTYTTEIIGETGKIYVDLSTNKTYRWGGSNYIEISESLALGETSSTAYRGDYGKIAYEHAQSTNNPHNVVPSVYGYCYTERRQTTKIVTINDFKLIPGMIIFIRFSYGVPYQAYLNISNTGDKPIYYKGKINDLCVTEDGSNDIIQAGDIVTFIYDAANNRYNLISTNIIGNQRMGSGDGYCDAAASVNEKSVSIRGYVPFEGGIVSIYFVNAVNANSRLKINNYSSAYMYYKNNIIGNNIIKAGDRATFMHISSAYYLISLDRDFNDPITIDSSLSTTSNNPVRNRVITNALNNYMPTIVGTQIESTNNWTGNAQFETLEDGQRILYYLSYDNSSGSDVVLNLTLADGTTQTGNIDCYLSGSARLNSQYEAGSFIPLIYKENITFNGSSTTYTGWWAYTDKDIDSKVQNTLNNTTKAYVTGTTNNTTNIGTQIFDDNVYLGTTAGELNTKSLKLNEKVTLNYNTNNNCIDFIFS